MIVHIAILARLEKKIQCNLIQFFKQAESMALSQLVRNSSMSLFLKNTGTAIKVIYNTNYKWSNRNLWIHITNNLNAPLTENQKPPAKTNVWTVYGTNLSWKAQNNCKSCSKIYIIERQTIDSTRSTISTPLTEDQQPPTKQNRGKHDFMTSIIES